MIITMIRSEGIWQSADHRLTIGRKIVDNAAPKQLNIACPPLPDGPKLLLGFTGLAEFPDGTPTLQWLRETLRGENRPIMQMFDHIENRIARDVGSSPQWRVPLGFCGGIFEGSRRFYFEIRNVDPKTWRPKRQFDHIIHEVTQPSIYIAGSGAYYVTQEDWKLLIAQANIRPAKWEDHLGLLAGVNRRTAPLSKNTVSPWCQASFLSSEREGAHTRGFAKPGEPEQPVGMQTVYAGLDFFEITSQLIDVEFLKTGRESSMPDPNDALRRSVESRP